MEKIRVGIIGCGKITQTRHAPEYAENPNVVIYGLYDADKDRLKTFTTLYSCKGYDSAEELIADPDIDAISICSPNFTHAEYAIKALKAGKHVLVEKPVALDTKDSKEMIRVAAEEGKILMAGHNQRLLPTHKKAREVLEAGGIGKILNFQSNFKHAGPETWSIAGNNTTWFFDKAKAQFGALGDLGAHKLDIIRYLTNREVKSVNAITMTVDKKYPDGTPISVEDNAMVFFKMEDDLPGIMHVSWTNYGNEDNSTIIYGDKGVMKIFGDYSDDIVLEMRDGSTVKYMVGQIQTNNNQTKSGIIDEFIDSIVNSRQPLITGVDGHNTLAALLACAKSAETGTWVDVEY